MSQLVRVLTTSEPWAEYQLEDGTLLRFRFSACSFRLTGKLANGDPEYSFSHSLQVETHAPPVVAEVRQLRALPKRLKAGLPLAEGYTLIGKSEPIGDTAPSEYCAPDQDCG